jgi:hypothetical protein
VDPLALLLCLLLFCCALDPMLKLCNQMHVVEQNHNNGLNVNWCQSHHIRCSSDCADPKTQDAGVLYLYASSVPKFAHAVKAMSR